jgi:hypothetical protein
MATLAAWFLRRGLIRDASPTSDWNRTRAACQQRHSDLHQADPRWAAQQWGLLQKAGISADRIGLYCHCMMEYMADIVTPAEMSDLLSGGDIDVDLKAKIATDVQSAAQDDDALIPSMSLAFSLPGKGGRTRRPFCRSRCGSPQAG